jgi:hypothetical protein
MYDTSRSNPCTIQDLVVGCTPQNKLLPRFINKATTAEPIQGREENLLHSISNISKIKHGKPKLATENI